MTTAALTHGYPPLWNMGGEVSLHRTLIALNGEKFVLTNTEKPYTFEGVHVDQINTPNVLNVKADPAPIAQQLQKIKPKVVIGQNELSLAAVHAANLIGATSIVNVHTPPRYGANLREAMRLTDYAIYNTRTAAEEWGEPNALVVHPPISPLPSNTRTGGDAYTLLSSLVNKGVTVVLDLAKLYPDKRFIIVRSPAEPTHGLKDLEQRAASLPNVELHPRVPPEEVHKYLEQTKILLVPSRYETYGMSTIEAAGYGIPTVHVDTPHVREGIGDGAILVPPLDVGATAMAINTIEKNYDLYSLNARKRAEWLHVRQQIELERLAEFIDTVEKPANNRHRQRAIDTVARRTRY
jgi:glycosyltransferase involved in cell wall biosynthesis